MLAREAPLDAVAERGNRCLCDVGVGEARLGRPHDALELLYADPQALLVGPAARRIEEVLLVLDATNGQNAIRQAEAFTKSIGCTGVILTKLDGTAKGGVVVAIRQALDLPVKFIGVGEGIDDLQPFDAELFVESLFS